MRNSVLTCSLISACLLTACGGGGGGGGASGGSGGAAKITVSNPTASSNVVAGTAVTFGGGACGGGQGTLSASWDFGDGSVKASSGTHTFTAAGTYSVSVTCTDSSSDPSVTSSATPVTVAAAPAISEGFLARNWTAFAAIDSTNTQIYPIAGLDSNGTAYGLWLQNNSTTTSNVISGLLDTTSASTWTIGASLPTGTANVAVNNSLFHTIQAPIDMAVSPNGNALAAWVAGGSLWYSTRGTLSGWSAPVQTAISPSSPALKVVYSDGGIGAIAYCNSSGAQVAVFSSSTGLSSSSQGVSNKCSAVLGTSSNTQITYGFDLAINPTTSAVTAVGLMPSPTTSANSVVQEITYTTLGGWGTPFAVSSDLPTASFPSFSVSLSVSPSGSYSAVAWSNLNATGSNNVFARVLHGGTVGDSIQVQPNDSLVFFLPLIAINDAGNAFLVMANQSSSGGYDPYATTYSEAAGWKTAPLLMNSLSGFGAIDVAIDQYGNGLATYNDANLDLQAYTLSADGTKAASVLITQLGYGDFHYQRLRALPDGRAILTASNKADTGYAPSGFAVLK